MKLAGKSDEALQKATKKTWQEWIDILDSAGLQDTSHKEIVQWLWDEGYVGDNVGQMSGWWAQSVVVGYEYHHGRRVKGQTSDAGFQVGVQKTVDCPKSEVWNFLLSDQGLKTWLSPEAGLDQVNIKKGADYEISDGTKGSVRSVQEGEKLRLTWQPPARNTPITMQIYLSETFASSGKTRILFHNEKLTSPSDRKDMKTHWSRVLEQIGDSLSAPN